MINLFQIGISHDKVLTSIPSLFDTWDVAIKDAEQIFEIDGEKIVKIAREVPRHQFYYAGHMQDSRSLMRWLELLKQQKESFHLKNYHNLPRALGVKEQSIYIQGEKDVVELNELIVQTNLYFSQFEQIVEAIKQMGWSVANIVKLRVQEMQDAII